MSADTFTWTSDIAKDLFVHLEKDARDLAIRMGIEAPPHDSTATAIAASHYNVPRNAEEWQKRAHEYSLAVRPIRDEMVRLVGTFTIPKPMVIPAS